jgi:hypothetical protein
MPELMLSALDILFFLVTIAAALWLGYLVWQNWLRNQPLFSRRPLNLAFFQSAKPVDRSAPRYEPKPAGAERLDPPPEMSSQPPTPLQAVSKSKAAISKTLVKQEFFRLREEVRRDHPKESDDWVVQEVWKRLETEEQIGKGMPVSPAEGEQNPLE